MPITKLCCGAGQSLARVESRMIAGNVATGWGRGAPTTGKWRDMPCIAWRKTRHGFDHGIRNSVLAVQMSLSWNQPSHRLMRETLVDGATLSPFRRLFMVMTRPG